MLRWQTSYTKATGAIYLWIMTWYLAGIIWQFDFE